MRQLPRAEGSIADGKVSMSSATRQLPRKKFAPEVAQARQRRYSLATASLRDCASAENAVGRRHTLIGLATAVLASAQSIPVNASKMLLAGTAAATKQGFPASAPQLDVNHSLPGPLTVAPFPELEHTCSRCFPACLGNRCMLRLEVIYPKDGRAHGAGLYFFPGAQTKFSILPIC